MKKYIILLLVFISFFSCRTVKKEWVKENFTEKATTNEIRVVQDSTFKSEILKLETSISKIEISVSKNETISETTTENETTNVSGSITAEDGKEKSVTIGGTTIKSNGANVTFETSSSKAFTKQFESQLQELETKFEQTSKELSDTKMTLSVLKSEFANFVSTYESEKTAKSKEVEKSGFGFGVWLIIIIAIILLLAFLYFKSKTSFLDEITGL